MQLYKESPVVKKHADQRQTFVVRVTPAKAKEVLYNKPDTYGRNFGLDLLRFLAIMLVMLDHGSYLYYKNIPEFIGNNISLTGHWGVQIFFVLSGFLIGRILIREASSKPFNFSEIVNFWKRRWFRTLPNYFLFIGIFTLIYFAVPDSVLKTSHWRGAFDIQHSRYIVYYLFCLQNFFVTNINFMGHTWSLAVEEWFYLLLPGMIFPIIYFYKKGALKNKLVLYLAGLAVFFMMIRAGAVAHMWPSYTKLSVIYNLDNLMIGVIMAWAFTYHKAAVQKRKNVMLAISATLFVAGFLLQNKYILTGHPNEAWDALIIPLQTIAFACALPWFYGINLKRKTWLARMVMKVSIVSYSIYLSHFIILVFVIDTIQARFHIESLAGTVSLFLLFLIITVWVSSVNYRLFEKRITALRERVSHS